MKENIVGIKIKELIERSKMTQKAFADKYEINTGTLSSYIHGRMLPPLELMIEICDGEMTTMDWLTGREEQISDDKEISYSTFANCIYHAWGNEYVFDDVDVSQSISNDQLRQITIRLSESRTDSSEKMFDMLEGLNNNISIGEKLNVKQAQVLKDDLLAQYMSLRF